MHNILNFSVPIKLSDDIIEYYSDIFERLELLKFRDNLLKNKLLDKKLFSGCHSKLGDLPSDVYKILLSFNNNPSVETWIELKDQLIFGRISAFDILVSEYPNYSNNLNNDFPTIEEFKNAFSILIKKTLEKNEEYIIFYSDKLLEIEKENPSILKIFKRNLL